MGTMNERVVGKGLKSLSAAVANSLRKEISTLRPGQMLPPEHNLAMRYSISRATVRKVLGILEDDGLLRTYPGRGRVVLDPLSRGEARSALPFARKTV